MATFVGQDFKAQTYQAVTVLCKGIDLYNTKKPGLRLFRVMRWQIINQVLPQWLKKEAHKDLYLSCFQICLILFYELFIQEFVINCYLF